MWRSGYAGGWVTFRYGGWWWAVHAGGRAGRNPTGRGRGAPSTNRQLSRRGGLTGTGHGTGRGTTQRRLTNGNSDDQRRSKERPKQAGTERGGESEVNRDNGSRGFRVEEKVRKGGEGLGGVKKGRPKRDKKTEKP